MGQPDTSALEPQLAAGGRPKIGYGFFRASTGIEARSLDSEPKVLAVTPHGQLHELPLMLSWLLLSLSLLPMPMPMLMLMLMLMRALLLLLVLLLLLLQLLMLLSLLLVLSMLLLLLL